MQSELTVQFHLDTANISFFNIKVLICNHYWAILHNKSPLNSCLILTSGHIIRWYFILLKQYLQTWWTWGKLLSMLPMPNVIPTARTWYLTGPSYFYFVNSWSQQPGRGGDGFPFIALSCFTSSRNRAVTFLWSPPRNCLHPGPSWDGAGSHRHQHHCNNPAVMAGSQRKLRTYKTTCLRQTSTRWAGTQPRPSFKYMMLGTCCMG